MPTWYKLQLLDKTKEKYSKLRTHNNTEIERNDK